MSAWFWKDGEAVFCPETATGGVVRDAGLANCYCVDLNHTQPRMRYGMFMPRTDPRINPEWTGQSLEDFPPEFRMHLLLEGVGV